MPYRSANPATGESIAMFVNRTDAELRSTMVTAHAFYKSARTAAPTGRRLPMLSRLADRLDPRNDRLATERISEARAGVRTTHILASPAQSCPPISTGPEPSRRSSKLGASGSRLVPPPRQDLRSAASSDPDRAASFPSSVSRNSSMRNSWLSLATERRRSLTARSPARPATQKGRVR